MVKKFYCDVCEKKIDLFGLVPSVAIDDPTVGQTVSIALNDCAYDEVHLCKEHTKAFLKVWDEFKASGVKV